VVCFEKVLGSIFKGFEFLKFSLPKVSGNKIKNRMFAKKTYFLNANKAVYTKFIPNDINTG
jgi:hypothetical protein